MSRSFAAIISAAALALTACGDYSTEPATVPSLDIPVLPSEVADKLIAGHAADFASFCADLAYRGPSTTYQVFRQAFADEIVSMAYGPGVDNPNLSGTEGDFIQTVFVSMAERCPR